MLVREQHLRLKAVDILVECCYGHKPLVTLKSVFSINELDKIYQFYKLKFILHPLFINKLILK